MADIQDPLKMQQTQPTPIDPGTEPSPTEPGTEPSPTEPGYDKKNDGPNQPAE